ncbi:MAG TPA: cupredoxin domain-containing protein [Pseudolabrys sp.]|nr:cupredoxin domain-containing protein [Pseudolabrys sp.]
MKMIKRLPLALLMMPALLSGWATTATSHEYHSTYSAGEPGHPKKPAREITVEMSEMDYSPAVIEVKRGEQIKFIVRNVGTEDHEFLLASTEDNLKHAAAMRKHPGMAHDEPNGLRLARKQSGEMLWNTAGNNRRR